ncbi:hypothetical protein HK101_011435 [Irineochytrium annulatum]|nr:hypothetical protein HK101_011435 [Irineochytrium annulatum]
MDEDMDALPDSEAEDELEAEELKEELPGDDNVEESSEEENEWDWAAEDEPICDLDDDDEPQLKLMDRDGAGPETADLSDDEEELLPDADDLEPLPEHFSQIYPYRNEIEFLLFKLFYNDRFIVSTVVKEAILEFLKDLKQYMDLSTLKIPSLYRLKQLKKELLVLSNLVPRKIKTATNKVVHYASVADTVRLQLSNPDMLSKLKFIPEETALHSELVHSQKWRREILTPVVRNSHGVLGYRGEIYAVTLANGGSRTVRIDNFFSANGVVKAVVNLATITNGRILIDSAKFYSASVDNVIRSFAVTNAFEIFESNENGSRPAGPTIKNNLQSPTRRDFPGLRVVNVPLVLWSDDTSGNISKKWIKVVAWAYTLAGLPFKEAQKPKNIHFICTSKSASGFESSEAIVKSIRDSSGCIRCYDSLNNEVFIAMVSIFLIAGDNPAQSELCSHIGMNGNLPCRMCDIPQPNSSVEHLRQFIGMDGDMPVRDVRKLITKHRQELLAVDLQQRPRRLAAAVKELAQAKVKDMYFEKFGADSNPTFFMNPLLGTGDVDLGFNGAIDSPFEQLHCLLLGLIKYSLRATMDNSYKAEAGTKGAHKWRG